ncbi:MAG: FGGY family carbohydrate kinase [Geminicoccaceae bacterium]|nr:FGGY family carbohydrate kinase [Geminicoccaceae bacterium]
MAILAADLGGSASKVGLVDDRGRLLAARLHPLRDREPAPGLVEQEALAWWEAFAEGARALATGLSEPIEAIAITGATRCEVLVDAAGQPLAPAILFRDRRATAEAAELAADPALAGAGPIDASHPLARLLWLARHAPELLARTRAILEPTAFLAFRLTGEAARDPLSAHRLAAPAVRAAAERLGLPLALLPPVRPLGALTGHLLPEPARALGSRPGIPVVAAPMDAWCSTLATGAVAAGRAYASAGSSLVAGLIVDRPVAAPGLLAPPWGPGLWHLGGPSRTGGAALDWLARLTGMPVEALLAAAEATAEREAAPFCHPWPAGERVPFLAPELRARFWNLDAETSPGELARALLEGLAFWVRLTLERAETAAGLRAAALRLAGGLAGRAVFPRLLAAALGRPVLVFAARETALVGAAGLALFALGRFADLEAVQRSLVDAAAPATIAAEPGAIARAEQRFRHLEDELQRLLAPRGAR